MSSDNEYFPDPEPFAINRDTGVPYPLRRSARPVLPSPVLDWYILMPDVPKKKNAAAHGKSNKSKPKPREPTSAPAASSSNVQPHPVPRPGKRKEVPESSLTPAPGERTVSQVAATDELQPRFSTKRQHIEKAPKEEVPPYDPAFDKTHVRAGDLVEISTAVLGFDPILADAPVDLVPDSRGKLTPGDIAMGCDPARYGDRKFVAPAFAPDNSLTNLMSQAWSWLNSVILFDYSCTRLLDPATLPIPTDDQLVLPPPYVPPEMRFTQTVPLPIGAMQGQVDENRLRNCELHRQAEEINARLEHEADDAYQNAKAIHTVELERAWEDAFTQQEREHKLWVVYEEKRAQLREHFRVVANTYLLYAAWRRNQLLATHRERMARFPKTVQGATESTTAGPSTSTSASAPLSSRVVGGRVLRGVPGTVDRSASAAESRGGSVASGSESDDNEAEAEDGEDGEDEVDPPEKSKSAGKRRARSPVNEYDFATFCKETWGYVVVGSHAKKSGVVGETVEEMQRLEFEQEECIWKITGPHIIFPPRDLSKKLIRTHNGYHLSPTNPKYVAGLEHFFITPAHLGPITYFVRGAGCVVCHKNDLPCVRMLKGHKLNQICTECAHRNHFCAPVMPFEDFNWSVTDKVLLDINSQFFFSMQVRYAEVMQFVTARRFVNASLNATHPVFGYATKPASPSVAKKSMRPLHMESRSEDDDVVLAPPSTATAGVNTPPPVAGTSSAPLSFPAPARRESPVAVVLVPSGSKTPAPPCTSPAQVASPLFPPGTSVSSSPPPFSTLARFVPPSWLSCNATPSMQTAQPSLASQLVSAGPGGNSSWEGPVVAADTLLAKVWPEVPPPPAEALTDLVTTTPPRVSQPSTSSQSSGRPRLAPADITQDLVTGPPPPFALSDGTEPMDVDLSQVSPIAGTSNTADIVPLGLGWSQLAPVTPDSDLVAAPATTPSKVTIIPFSTLLPRADRTSPPVASSSQLVSPPMMDQASVFGPLPFSGSSSSLSGALGGPSMEAGHSVMGAEGGGTSRASSRDV
ncbi:hypothetical protein C8J57DRAFT_1492339 [Mycena rebaudengoi]|nr:hypothetical protein C8J57DRAFT_1492339 [Mycena rebaudengoi]